MKILVVHPRMSIKGGGERVAIQTILAGLKAGHAVTLISESFDTSEFEDFFGTKGLFARVDRITYPSFAPFLGKGLLLYQRLAYHQKHLRNALSRSPDFDLVLGTQDIGYVPTVRSHLIQYCYFPEYFTHLEAKPSSPLWRLYYWPASRFYRERVGRVERFLSVSDYTRAFIREKWNRDSETLYPPCPVETYLSERGPKENVAITVGRIVPEKRMHVFIEMARQLPQYRFVIVGSLGPSSSKYYDSLSRSLPKNASIVLSPLRRVKDLLNKAKVYVHCAENEHFGITIVESMAARCVPVVHDSGGPKEIVQDRIGFRWRDLPTATDQISMIMENNSLRETLSENAVSRAAGFSSEAYESRLVKILSQYS